MLLAGLLTGAFLTTMIAGIVLVSVIGSTDVLSGSNKVTVRAWVNIGIGVILIAGAVYILINRGQRRLLHRRKAKAAGTEDAGVTGAEKQSGWSKRAGAADSFWAAAIIGVAIDLPSVWFLAALKYLIDAAFLSRGRFPAPALLRRSRLHFDRAVAALQHQMAGPDSARRRDGQQLAQGAPAVNRGCHCRRHWDSATLAGNFKAAVGSPTGPAPYERAGKGAYGLTKSSPG